MADSKLLRALFLKYLTVDSETHDARRKDFNQAIFIDSADKMLGGKQVFTETDLDMVMEKFDKAVKEWEVLSGGISRQKRLGYMKDNHWETER